MKYLKLYKEFEGVADVYAEKEFHIPYDDFVPVESSNNDKPIMKILKSNIYKNPKDLSKFDTEVRAIGTIEGDLYVADTNDNFMHGTFGDFLSDNGFIKYKPDNNYFNKIYSEQDRFVLLNRVPFTNMFGLSDTSWNWIRINPNNRKICNEIIDNINKKNPNIKVMCCYYEHL